MEANNNGTNSNSTSPEGYIYGWMLAVAHDNDRLMYIYVFTAIIVATVIITLIRSFIFFSVNRLSHNFFSSLFLFSFICVAVHNPTF